MAMRLRLAPCLVAVAAILTVSGAHAETDFDRIQLGRYLTDAGDCVACHTKAGGKPFAGGAPLATPFGVIYSPNITPDRETGIGAWSDDEFYRAMHEGISRDGSRLYPAFPYPHFTHVTRSDVDAIRAYLATLEPVSSTPPRNELPFPLNQRVLMRAWNWMFFDDASFQPDPKKSDAWNRGAYLVEGLGHCATCHTPRNAFGSANSDQSYAGGNLQNWLAPDLGPDLRTGLGRWTEQDIAEYLKTGRNALSNASGPMAEVIEHSTSRLTDEDVRAIATYLKDLPNPAAKPAGGEASATQTSGLDPAVAQAGEAIFTDQCAACHRLDGSGEPGFFPRLKGNPNVQQNDPSTIVHIILEGTRTAVTPARPTPLSMPAYAWKLNDAQVAAVASYVRNSWSNSAPAVSPDQVQSLRKAMKGDSD
jgi:mono/diheme cytochrome c family protein